MKNIYRKLIGAFVFTFVCLFGLFIFDADNSYALTINSPIIESFEPVKAEDNALKITFKSNNTITNYSYEIYNTTDNTISIISGASKAFVLQNLELNKKYDIIVRACINSMDEYKCSSYTNLVSAVASKKAEASTTSQTKVSGATQTLKIPTFISLVPDSNSSLKLNYKVTGTVTGIEVTNVTTGNTIKTANKETYTYFGLKEGTAYKFRIRSYLTVKGKTIYSSYTTTKSATTLKKEKPLSGAEKIARTAEELAWPRGTSKKVYRYKYSKKKKFSKWSQLGKSRPTKAYQKAYDRVRPRHFKINAKYPPTRVGASCDVFVGTVIRASGYDSKYPFGLQPTWDKEPVKKRPSLWKKVTCKKSNLKRGDIIQYNRKKHGGHTYIWLGNGKAAEAGYGSMFGKITKAPSNPCYKGNKSKLIVRRAVK